MEITNTDPSVPDTVNSVPTTLSATTALTPPSGKKFVDPFALYAEREGGDTFFDGDFIKLDKTIGWYRGQHKEPISATTIFVANIHAAQHGWVRFPKSDGEGVKHEIVLIMEQPILPRCPVCGENADEHNDKVCDWRAAVYLPMRLNDDPNDTVCYSGTGMGARRALGDLCKIYRRADRQGKSPVILLESFTLKNEHGTVWPRFTHIVGWEFFTPDVPAPEVQPVAVPIKPPKPLPKSAGKRGDMDDEIPF